MTLRPEEIEEEAGTKNGCDGYTDKDVEGENTNDISN